MISLSMSISSTMESALEMISSPFSSRVYKIGYKFGLCEIDPAKSPLLSNTASHVPIPPGTLFTQLVSTLCLFNLRTTSSPSADVSTMLTYVGLSSTFAMSSTTFRVTPPCMYSIRPALRPSGTYISSGKPLISTNTAPITTIPMVCPPVYYNLGVIGFPGDSYPLLYKTFRKKQASFQFCPLLFLHNIVEYNYLKNLTRIKRKVGITYEIF